VSAILLKDGLHATRRDVLGQALERFGEKVRRGKVLLSKLHGGTEQGGRGLVVQPNPASPLDHRVHLLDIGAGGTPPVEERLHTRVLPDCNGGVPPAITARARAT
jgi:hypothetical protein